MTVGLSKFRSNIINRRLAQLEGRVVEIVGLLVKAQGIALPVGETCLVKNRNGDIPAEVIGFNEDRHTLLMVLGNMEGISRGSYSRRNRVQEWAQVVVIEIWASPRTLRAPVGHVIKSVVLLGISSPCKSREARSENLGSLSIA